MSERISVTQATMLERLGHHLRDGEYAAILSRHGFSSAEQVTIAAFQALTVAIHERAMNLRVDFARLFEGRVCLPARTVMAAVFGESESSDQQ